MPEGLQRAPGAVHQGRIQHALVLPQQRAQLGRHGEGDQEVRRRHQRLGLPGDPALAFEELAMRAEPVTAGMRHQTLIAALAALGQHARGKPRAACRHGRQGLALAGQHTVAVAGQVGLREALDDAGQRDHWTPAQSRVKRAIRASMRALACSVVWLVRWV